MHRYDLDNALSNEIKAKNNNRANQLIDMMLVPASPGETPGFNLASVSGYRRESFLYEAIDAGNFPIAKRLFLILQNTPYVIFGVTDDGRNLLHAIAKSNCLELMDDVINAAKMLNKKCLGKYEHLFWVLPDQKKQAPIALAVKNGHFEATQKLIYHAEQYSKDDSIAVLQYPNEDGKNLLHHLFAKTPRWLRKNGALFLNLLFTSGMTYKDFNRPNKYWTPTTPFLSFIKLELEHQAAIFNNLKELGQLIILDSCRDFLLDQSTDLRALRVKRVFFTLAPLIGSDSYLREMETINKKLPWPSRRMKSRNAKQVASDLQMLNEIFDVVEKELRLLPAKTKEYKERREVVELNVAMVLVVGTAMLGFAYFMRTQHTYADQRPSFEQAMHECLSVLIGFTGTFIWIFGFLPLNLYNSERGYHHVWKPTVDVIANRLLPRLSLLANDNSDEKKHIHSVLAKEVSLLQKDQSNYEACRLFEGMKQQIKHLENYVKTSNKPI